MGRNLRQQLAHLVVRRDLDFNQRTLTVVGMITVRLVSSLTRLELTNKGNMLLFVCGEAVASKSGDQLYNDSLVQPNT